MVSLTYMILWWERAEGVDIRRLFHLWGSSRIRDALCEIPRWVVGLIVTRATAVGLILIQVVFGESPFSFLTMAKVWNGISEFGKSDTFNIYGFIIAMMFF